MPKRFPDRPAGPKKALVTLVIGKLDYADQTIPLMRRWAEKEGWEFLVLTQRRMCYNPNWPWGRFGIHVEKFQIFDLFQRFERIIYMDADILVNPAIPDPFSLVPKSHVGGVWDDTGEDAWKREEELGRLVRRHGPLPRPQRTGPRFLNAGVLVLSRQHQDLWRFDRSAFIRGRWPEQSLVNYRLLRNQTPIFELPDTFNLMPLHEKQWSHAETRRSAYLVHYASRPAKADLSKDLPHFERGWAELEMGQQAALVV